MAPRQLQAASRMRSPKFTDDEWAIIDAFHRLYYESRRVGNPQWFHMQILKTPLDLWAYQETLVWTKPDWLIETGTCWGGSAFFFATIMDLLGHGHVCTIDQSVDILGLYKWVFGDQDVPIFDRVRHPRITYVEGHVLDPKVLAWLAANVKGRIMVSLDSQHDAEHVAQELELYAPLVSPGCYLVVEDTNTGGHPVERGPWHGAWDATIAFLDQHPEFEVVHAVNERFLMSFHTWLRRLEDPA